MIKYKYFILISIVALFTLNIVHGQVNTTEYCNNLLKRSSNSSYNPSESYVDVTKLGSLPLADIIKCGSPLAAKTQEISPIAIFQLIISTVTILVMGLSVVFLIIAGILIATSTGEKTKFQEGVELAKNSALAFVLTFLAYNILSYVLGILGFKI